MKSYPPSVSPVPMLTDEATLDAALEHVLASIPLETQGIYSPQTIHSVLLWAASRHDTIEGVAESGYEAVAESPMAPSLIRRNHSVIQQRPAHTRFDLLSLPVGLPSLLLLEQVAAFLWLACT